MKILEARYKVTSVYVLTLLFWFLTLTGCEPVRPTAEVTEVVKTETISPTATASRTRPPPTLEETDEPEPIKMLDVNPDDLRGETVQFWHTWSGESGEIIEEHVKKFNETNQWGIVVRPENPGSLDTMCTEIARALEDLEPPDLAVAYLHQIQAWEPGGKVVDLTPYVEDPVWGFTLEEQGDFVPAFWEHDLSAGTRLGIPAQRSGVLLFYNVSWAEELGFSQSPDTPELFREQACASAEAYRLDEDPENDGMGGWIVSSDHAAILGWISAFGGDIYKPGAGDSGESVYAFNTKEVDETFTFLRELYDEGCAWKSESHIPEFEFANRQGLFAAGSLLDLPFQKEAFRETRNRDEWAVIPFPSPDNEPAFNAYGPSYVMFASNPERELASWLFIKWLSDAEQQARLVEASGAFPLRRSTLEKLDDYAGSHPQWAGAVEGLSSAKPEPSDSSWGVVRWALGDAAVQLFMYYFSIEEIPGLLEFLDHTAFELYLGPVGSGLLDTPTLTPSQSATATITPTPSRTATITPTSSRTATNTPSSTRTPALTLSPPTTSPTHVP